MCNTVNNTGSNELKGKLIATLISEPEYIEPRQIADNTPSGFYNEFNLKNLYGVFLYQTNLKLKS